MADEDEDSTAFKRERAEIRRRAEIASLALEQRVDRAGKLAPASPDDETERDLKRARDRGRDKFRQRQRPPSGYVALEGGRIERKDAPKFHFHVDEVGRMWVPADPSRTIDRVDAWAIGQLQELIEEALGTYYTIGPGNLAEATRSDRGPVERLNATHRAFEAAFGCPARHWWQKVLREQVEHALHDPTRPVEDHASDIARVFVFGAPWIPPQLNAAAIAGILRQSALTRGGGPKQKVKSRDIAGITRKVEAPRPRNFQNVVDDFVQSIGEEVWRPHSPPI